MAWVTPSTQTTGDIIAATTWNQNVVANTAYLKGQAGVVTAFENGVTIALTLAVTGATTLTGLATMPGGASITGLILPSYMDMTQGAAPSNPAAGTTRIYAKSDGALYTLNGTAGTEQPLGGGGYARSFLLMGG